MNKSLETVLKALEQDALAFCSESDWAIVVAECERAGNVRRISKSAQVILQKAMSRSEAGRFAAEQRWKNHQKRTATYSGVERNTTDESRKWKFSTDKPSHLDEASNNARLESWTSDSEVPDPSGDGYWTKGDWNSDDPDYGRRYSDYDELSGPESNDAGIDYQLSAQARDAGISFGPRRNPFQDMEPFSDEVFNDIKSGKTTPIATGFDEVRKGIDEAFAKILEAESDPIKVKSAMKVKRRLLTNMAQQGKLAQEALEELVSASDPRQAMKELKAAGAHLSIEARQARLKQFERYEKPEASVTIRAALNLENAIVEKLYGIISEQAYGVGKRLGTFRGGNGHFDVGGVINPDGY